MRNSLHNEEGVKICFHINVNLIHMFLSVRFSQNSHIVWLNDFFTLVNLVKYSNNCKNSGVYMVKAYGLVAITCIIKGPFDNESTKTSNGYVRCRYFGKESSYYPKLSMSDKIFIHPYNICGL